MLEFYWSVGRDLVTLRAEERWGRGVVKQFALDMRNSFPDSKGFSDTNVKYMKQWYSFYYELVTKSHQVGGHMDDSNENKILSDKLEIFEKSHQAGDNLEMPDLFGLIPWKHHVAIFSRSKSLEEALFYMHQVIDGNWSRSELETEIRNNLFSRQGSAITNFTSTLPVSHGKLAQEILKDPYNVSFLGVKEISDEKELEDALVNNITKFLLELGQGFAYVGRQMELQMPSGQAFFPDLLFYHIHLKSYVVIELKTVKFIPEFAGKINFYVNAVDELLRREDDNPTIGLIICQSKDETVVQWSFRGIDRPLGVATYQLEEVVARTVAEMKQKKLQK